MNRIYFIALVATTITCAEAKSRYFVPVISNSSQNQKFEYKNGVPVLLHQGGKLSLASVFIPESKKQGWLSVSLVNNADKSIVISEASFSAVSLSSPLKVYTFNELQKILDKKEFWESFGVLASAAANSYNAGMAGSTYTTGTYQSTTNAQYNSSGYSAYGRATTNGTYTAKTYDPQARQTAIDNASRRNQELIDGSANYALNRRASLSESALKIETLDSGETVSGQIRLDLPSEGSKESPAEFLVILKTDGEMIGLRYREFYSD